MCDTIRLHDIRMHTKALGPGTRIAVWFQGCERRCKGCMSESSRPLDGGKVVKIQDVIKTIINSKDVDGITISGGEPFLQTDALFSIVYAIRENTDFGIIIYTGNTLSQLRDMKDKRVDEILNGLVDVIIDGEYIEELNDGKSLRGSSNQNFHFITDRYKDDAAFFGSDSRNVEVIVSRNESFLIGVPDKEMFDKWKKMVGQGLE